MAESVPKTALTERSSHGSALFLRLPWQLQPRIKPTAESLWYAHHLVVVMFTLSFLVAVFSCCLLVVAKPLSSPYTLHEKRRHVPSGWSLVRRYPASHTLPLRFGLTQSNLHKLDEFLHNVSHPESPHYSQHWTPQQVAETFAPSAETVETVRNWLLESGFEDERVRVSPTWLWIEVNATAEEAERLLLAEYHVYQHESGKEHVACTEYHTPAHVTPHVDFITPTIHFDVVLDKRGDTNTTYYKPDMPGVGQPPGSLGVVTNILTGTGNCDMQITPECLRALYGILYNPISPSKNSYGIVEYTPQAFLQSDLDLFNKVFDPSAVGTAPVRVSIDGGVVQTTVQNFDLNAESDLDLQYGMNLVTKKQPVTLYQTGDLVVGASFNTLLDALDASYCTFQGGDDPATDPTYPDTRPGGFSGPKSCGITVPAFVISTSYGYNEADLSRSYAARQCAEYAKLGLMGVTVLYSSGDNGVAGNRGLCLRPDGSQSRDGTIFNPTFPGGCPYVTSVGATQVNPGATVWDPESACEQVIFSGGGFSNYFGIPDYQKWAVQNYLQWHRPWFPPGIWNSSGTSRGFPDISANGANYVVAVDGAFTLLFGTSASTPVVGAMLSNINDLRISVGKKPIGFINPTLYSDLFKGAFNDITSGSNRGCMTQGFSAVPGWDPVTGLGTPRFPDWLTRWLFLP